MSSIIKGNRINQLGIVTLGTMDTQVIYETPVEHQEVVETTKQKVAEKEINNQQTKLLEDLKKIKEEAEKEAKNILEEAKSEAQDIIQDAHQEKEEIVAQVHEEVAETRSATEQEKQAILDEILSEKERIIQEAYQEKEKLLQALEPEMVSILKTLLTRIVDVQIMGKGQWLELIVKKMIHSEGIAEAITIYLSEESYEKYGETLIEKMRYYKYPVAVEQDNLLSAAACAIETSKGIVQYDIQDGLNEVMDELDGLQNLVG